jgi:hypothetical protein
VNNNNNTLTKTDKRVARPLSVIAGLIKKERQHADEDSKDHWKQIALLLVEAFVHFNGNWKEFEKWFDGEQFDFGFRSARDKLRALNNVEKVAAAKSIPFWKARKPDHTYTEPEDEVREKVRKSVEFSRRIMAEAAVKRDESDAIRKLALQIVDVGFKLLSTKFHPDRRGGSADAMRRLNAARALLKGYL